jgi:Resolvase, N terminal domain
MRVAIYARVSTNDKGQDPENQLRELRAWCANSGHTVAGEYVEAESGGKGADKRKQFAALLEDAAKRKFDLVLFWALDRFSREGMAQTIAPCKIKRFQLGIFSDGDVETALGGPAGKDLRRRLAPSTSAKGNATGPSQSPGPSQNLLSPEGIEGNPCCAMQSLQKTNE